MGDIIAAVDIGSSKVCAMIGLIDKNNNIDVLGKGFESCLGIKKGTIIDLDSVTSAISSAVKQAENSSNLRINNAYVNIMGSQINILSKKVGINISRDVEVTYKDVENVLEIARSSKITEDDEIIDIVAKNFELDGCEDILDPVGMSGSKLEVNADIIYGKSITVRNIKKCFEMANIKLAGFVIEPYALGDLFIEPEEREMGVILIDVGATMTGVSVFYNKELVFFSAIPIGGEHITNDISIGLKIPAFEAERLKREYELALTSLIKNDQEIQVSQLLGNSKKIIRVSEVVEVIEARVYEIFSLSKELLESSRMYKEYGGGVILTGGGISYVDGSKELAQEVFRLPVRLTSYKGIQKLKPEYSIAAGIIRHVTNKRRSGSHVKTSTDSNLTEGKEKGIFKKLSSILAAFKD